MSSFRRVPRNLLSAKSSARESVTSPQSSDVTYRQNTKDIPKYCGSERQRGLNFPGGASAHFIGDSPGISAAHVQKAREKPKFCYNAHKNPPRQPNTTGRTHKEKNVKISGFGAACVYPPEPANVFQPEYPPAKRLRRKTTARCCTGPDRLFYWAAHTL